MNKIVIKKALFSLLALLSFSLFFNSCDSWMAEDDDFYTDIEDEVKKANAPQINVYVRYAATKMGKTDPDGYGTFKVEIPSTISATTETDYGFWRWAAFSTSFLTPGDTQYTSLIYEDDETYANNYAENELSSEIVKFDDPYASTTDVTIFEERNDIYIVPIVAKRPTIALSMPASGSSGIVRNMTVRINFTKAMKADSFQDGQGNFDKITVTQGTQSITSDGDIEISSEEITDRFSAPTFSTNGKMITLKFNEKAITEGFTAQSYVTISISKDVTDEFGYSMAEDYKLQFQVGSSFDTLAPRITELTAGVDKDFSKFGGVYKDANTVKTLGGLTKLTLDGASKADKNINNDFYTETICGNRIKNKINIRVLAEDIAGSGSEQDATGVESEVAMIGIKASTLVTMEGKAGDDKDSIPIKSLAYVAQTNASEIKGVYKDLTGSNKGYLFTYDLSSLPDGLIKIDVWGYDSIGNSGNGDGGAYSAEYGNGYASIFVVKDNTPPDVAENAALIRSKSEKAPYYWYNASSLASMEIFESSKGAVFDHGHAKLRSKADQLQWFFNVTDDTKWGDNITAEDGRFKPVSEVYTIKNAARPSKDGPVAISVIIKDDLGNVSKAGALSSIVYDNTAPVVTKPTWVKADGSTALNATKNNVVSGSILKIPFTDNLAGVRRIEVKVTGPASVAAPLSGAKVQYFKDASATPASGEGKLSLLTSEKDSAVSNTMIVTESELSGGVIYISNLNIGGTDGIYTVTVTMYDGSLNKSSAVSTTIAKDTTAPTVGTVTINNTVRSATAENSEQKTWLKKSSFDSAPAATKASVTFNVTETGSGITKIELGESAKLTANSTVAVGGSTLSSKDYTLNVAGNTITLSDSYNPKIYGSNVAVTINNIQLKNLDGASNTVAVKVTDFVSYPSGQKTSAEVYADSKATQISGTVQVSDAAIKSENSFTNTDIHTLNETNYTDSDVVTLKFSVDEESANGSGIKTITLTGATFSNTDSVKSVVKDVTDGASTVLNGTISGSVFTLNTPFTAAKDLEISNVRFTSAANETKSISVKIADLVGWESTVKASNSIVLDNTAPAITSMEWETTDSEHYVGGITNEQTELAYQQLVINYTEATAGIKKLRLAVSCDDSENPVPTTKPFASASLGVYIGDKYLKKDEDYTLNAAQNVLTFITPYKTGKITIRNIHTTDSDRANYDLLYKVTASLMDAAENSVAATSTEVIDLTRDNTKPVVTKVEIPGLKETVELSPGVSVQGPDNSWWLDHTYVGGNHNGNYAATLVPLYITINEKTSGVNRITLGGTMKLQSISTLWTVAEDGTETAVDASIYKVNTTANTITINKVSDSLKNAAGKDEFVILIKDLMATKTGGDTAAANTVSVMVSDVALNNSDANTQITQKGKAATLDGFYTDSWASGLAGVEIIDRGGLIPATAGYTNESIVDVYVHASAENKGYSGHNKFKLTGGKFTANSEIYIGVDGSSSKDALKSVKAGNAKSKKLAVTEYVISDDKTTIEFRNADASKYYVIRNHLALKFTNIQLNNPVEDVNSITCQPYDLVGWEEASAAKTGSIILDATKPEWRFEAGTFAANKSETINGEFIYPHPNATDTAYGIKSPTAEKNKDGEIVLYYYTASKISETANYGVVIGIGGKDANLRGYDKEPGVPYYICDTTGVSLSEIDAEYVVNHGSMRSTDCNGNTTGSNSGWKTGFNGWEIMFAGHTYSIVIVDEAGNYSEKAKTIKIVQDTTKPSVKLDGSKSLAEVFTLDIPAEAKVFRNESRIENAIATSGSTNNLYDTGSHRSPDYYSTNYVIKETSDDYKIVIKLNGRKTGDTMLDGTSAGTATSAYTQKAPTAADSGLAYYAVSHWYADWCASSSDTSDYKPAFPRTNSNVPDGSSILTYMGYGDMPGEPTGLTPKCSWHPYIAGNYTDTNTYSFDTIKSSVDSYGNISISIPKTEKTPPLALLLKDNCGNMNYILIRPNSMETDQKQTISFIVDDMISTDTSAPANRHVGFIPYATTNKKANDSNVTNDSNYKAIDLNGNVTTASYNWGNPTGPYQIGGGNLNGQTVIGTQARDLKSRITYYNEKAYMGIALKAETCNYSERKIASSNFADGKGYTLRARVRAWDATGAAPAKTDFDGSGSDFSSWVYLRDDGSDGNNNIFLQYPHPSRTSKFRLYYYVEDAVGNYEINTITNDNITDEAADQMLYWMYDNEKPVVKTRSGKNPATVTGRDIGELVATNNGFRPYYNAVTGTGYIVETQNKIVGTGLPATTSLGNGIILGCVRGENTKYGSYFDLNITETSGIRAFAYTSTSTAPAIPTSGNYGTASMGDDGTWYAGKTTCDGGTGMLATREIGSTLSYPYYSATSGTSLYSNAGDVTYDYYDASYGKGVYSGVKVVATIPYGVIKGDSTTPKDVYLHVMDWVGNITTVKLGDGIQWVNDSAGANNDGNPDTNIFKDNCNITCYNIKEPWNLQYTFASTKIPSDATSIKIYMPEGKYSDDAGSGLLGWSLKQNDLTSVDKDDGQTDAKYSYIKITDGILTKIKKGEDAGTIPVYIYDNVGNCAGVTLKLVGDKEPNEFTIFVRPGDGNKLFYVKDSSSASSQNQSTGSESSGTEITSLRDITAEAYTNDTKVTYLARFKDKKPASDLRILSIDRYTGSETPYDAANWTNVQKWETGNANTGWVYSAPHTDGYYYLDNAYSSLATHSDYLYYRLVTQDKAGNTNYAYVKVATDTTAPTVTLVDGSITGVNNIEGINYFNANSKAKMKYSDVGSGLKSYTGVSSITGYVTESPEMEVILGERDVVSALPLAMGAKDKLKFEATDNLGNGGSIYLSYKESNTWVKDITAPTYTPVANQSAVKAGGKNVSNTVYSVANGNFTLNICNNSKQASIYCNYNTDTKETNIIVNPQVFNFTFKLPSVTDTNFYGWKQTSSPLADTSWFDAATGGTVDKYTNGYSFYRNGYKNSGDNKELPDTGTKLYFYPIDMAGNIGEPVILSFVQAPLPIVGTVTPSGTINNYYNGNSTVSVEAVYSWGSGNMPIHYIAISDENNNYKLVDVKSQSITLPKKGEKHTFDNISLNGITGSTIDFEIITDLTSSESKSLTTLTYDNAGPTDIKVSAVKDQNDSNGFAHKESDTEVKFGSNATTLKVTFTATDAAGIEGFATSSTSATWANTVEFSSPRDGVPTVYAKDKLGNISSGTITFAKDASVSDVTDLTINSPDIGNGIYFNSTAKKMYFNTASVNFTPVTTDTDIAYFYYNDPANKSAADKSITLTPSAGTYTLFAVDTLGNVSSTGYSIEFISDTSVDTPTATYSWYKDSNTVEATDYVYVNESTLYYNSNQINKITFKPSVASDASGIKGYASSADSANWADKVTVENPSGAVTIYAKDNTGNVSAIPLTYTLKKDGTSPSVDTDYVSNNRIINYSPASGSVQLGYDWSNDYVLNYYNSDFGMTLTASDNEGAGVAGYALAKGNSDSTAPAVPDSFTATTGSMSDIKFPEDPGYHGYEWLFVKDKVGNVKSYLIANAGNNAYTWFKAYTSVSGASVSPTVSSALSGGSGNKCNVTTTVTLTGFTTDYAVSKIELTGLNTSYTDVPNGWNGNNPFTLTYNYAQDSSATVKIGSKNITATPSYADGKLTVSLEHPYVLSSTDTMTITVNYKAESDDSNGANYVENTKAEAYYPDVKVSSVEDNFGGKWTAPVANNSRKSFAASAVASVKSFFTPKTKKVDLSAQQAVRLAEEERAYVQAQEKASASAINSVVEKTAVAKAPKAAANPAKPVRENKELKGRVSKANAVAKTSVQLPEGAKVMEAVAITDSSVQVNVETTDNKSDSSIINSVVEKPVVQKEENFKFIYVVMLAVMVAVIGLVFILEKKLIDKVD